MPPEKNRGTCLTAKIFYTVFSPFLWLVFGWKGLRTGYSAPEMDRSSQIREGETEGGGKPGIDITESERYNIQKDARMELTIGSGYITDIWRRNSEICSGRRGCFECGQDELLSEKFSGFRADDCLRVSAVPEELHCRRRKRSRLRLLYSA